MLTRARRFDQLAVACFIGAIAVLVWFLYYTSYPYADDSLALRDYRLKAIFGAGGFLLACVTFLLLAWRNRVAYRDEQRHEEMLRAMRETGTVMYKTGTVVSGRTVQESEWKPLKRLEK